MARPFQDGELAALIRGVAQKVLAPLGLLLLAVVLAFGGQHTQPATATLGATPHTTGTTFRLWAPFVDEVAVKVKGDKSIALKKEDGHPRASAGRRHRLDRRRARCQSWRVLQIPSSSQWHDARVHRPDKRPAFMSPQTGERTRLLLPRSIRRPCLLRRAYQRFLWFPDHCESSPDFEAGEEPRLRWDAERRA
jgi:hypothetical protein